MEITVDTEGIALSETVEAFGRQREHCERVKEEELQNYSLSVRSTGDISVKDIISAERDENGQLESVSWTFDSADGLEVSIKYKKDTNETGGNEKLSHWDEIPAPPEIEHIPNETNAGFYRRMVKNPESQPATMRQIIHSEGTITKSELKKRMEDEGYNPGSSGFGTSLRVLSEITKELDFARL
jgi:hypothetical protein